MLSTIKSVDLTRVQQCSQGKAFFIGVPGGTGKTFLYSLLLCGCPQRWPHFSACCFLSHSRAYAGWGHDKLPVANVDEHSTCNLPLGEPTARLLQEARIIIWDEAPMSHKPWEASV
ncbi:hypothetical protein COCOBI_07-3730 [Coccomyxa sp. Obi]|nr:hypothetical protein COCOBI_07-3730 [Coccomyxa sp. Obi]